MSNQVYANNMELSCKAGNGKSIAAFPDVCFTPPQTPATPPGVPVPYPNTGLASDCTSGSKSVQISGQEIMLKDKSYFKQSSGDEAGSAPKKGVVTSKNMGRVYFKAWSMDVKIEGENAVRHLDLTTHNHACEPPNPPPTAHIDEAAQAAKCKEQKKDADTKCAGKTPDKCDDQCVEAQKCQLVPYNKSKEVCCAQGNTGDHIVEASSFHDKGRGGSGSRALEGCSNYSTNQAPCCCVKGGAYSGEHGRMSTLRGAANQKCPAGNVTVHSDNPPGASVEADHVTTYGEAKQRAAKALKLTFPQCDEACITKQLDDFHHERGIKDDTKIRGTTYGDPDKWAEIHGNQAQLETMNNFAIGGSPP